MPAACAGCRRRLSELQALERGEPRPWRPKAKRRLGRGPTEARGRGRCGWSCSAPRWPCAASSSSAPVYDRAFDMHVGYSAPAQAGLVCDIGLSNSEYGVFGSVLTIGALTSGRLAEILGRKMVKCLNR